MGKNHIRESTEVEKSSTLQPPRNVDESTSEMKLINKLNHDCLAKVLTYVPTVQRLEMENVCQKWKEASELSWYNIKKINFDELMITLDKREKILEMIMTRCCQYLTHLKINGFQYPWMCHVFKYNCQNIIHFSIDMAKAVFTSGYEITDKNLIEIIISMKKLKYLKISKIRICRNDGLYQVLDELPEDIEQIHLIVPNKSAYFHNDIGSVLNKFNRLHCLSLYGFRLTSASLESLLPSKDTLVNLDLIKCVFPRDALPILYKLNNLEHLKLWKVMNFNVNEITLVVQNCLKLKHLEFRNRNSLQKMVPYSIFRELKYLNLEHLSIRHIDTFGYDVKNEISEIASNWKQLKHLDVGYGYGFSMSDYKEITKFKNLQYLNFINININSQLFTNITSYCLKLKELRMCFDEILATDLEKLTNLKEPEILDFYYCTILTDNSLSKIANNCKNLIDLNLSSCYNITEASLIQVGKLQHLKRLNICWIENVPHTMFNDLHELEFLLCDNCPSITDEDIIKVLDNCQKLTYLGVTGTRVTVKTFIHASKRAFVFKPLEISVESSQKNNFIEESPYLYINDTKYKINKKID